MRKLPVVASLCALLVLLVPALVAFTQADPLEVVQRWFDANNRNDMAAMVDAVTDDYVQEGGGCDESPGGRCVGKEAFRAMMQSGSPADVPPKVAIVGTPQVSGSTVTAKLELRQEPGDPELQKLGVERLIFDVTIEVRGDKVAAARLTPDLTDAQTAKAWAAFQAPQEQGPQAGEAQGPGKLPDTGDDPSMPIGLVLGAGALLLLAGLALRRTVRAA